MTSPWVSLIVVICLIAALTIYLARRDRRRMPSADDDAADRTAVHGKEQWAAERHIHQGETIIRGRDTGSGGF